jgi:septation ring formation regulator EzrA
MFHTTAGAVAEVTSTDALGAVGTVLGMAAVAALAVLGKWLKSKLDGMLADDKLDRLLAQTENEHDETEYPNLRDELTAVRQIAERLEKAHEETRRDLGGLREDVRHARAETEGLREDHRDTRRWLGVEAVERRKLTEALEVHMVEARQRDERIAKLARRPPRGAE